jgi:ABC-2 type transport system permease protein
MTLFRQYFRQQAVGLLIWVGVAVLLVLALTSAASGVVASGMDEIMASLPEAMRQMAGVTTGLSPLDAYLTMKAGPFFALLLSPYAVLLALGIVTREVDRRTMDFLLAMPVERRQVIVSRSVVMALNTAVMAVAMWLVMYADLTRQGLDGSFGAYAVLLLNAWLLAMALGSVCLLTSMWLDDYSLGVRIWLSVACGGYVLEYILRAAGLSRWTRVWSPYSFLDAPEVVRSGTIPVADAVILIALVALGIGLSVRAFERKQIAA